MHPQLAVIVNELEEARNRLHRLSMNTSPEKWGVRAKPDSWSVAECVVHINLTSRAFIPLLTEALEHGRPRTDPRAPYRRDLAGWFLSVMVGPLPNVGRMRIGRVRTTPPFIPTGELHRDRIVEEFDIMQEEQLAIARRADGKNLEELKIRSPFSENLSYNVYSTLVILPRHQHRHLQQAEGVWNDP
jgi:hypothetical protein